MTFSRAALPSISGAPFPPCVPGRRDRSVKPGVASKRPQGWLLAYAPISQWREHARVRRSLTTSVWRHRPQYHKALLQSGSNIMLVIDMRYEIILQPVLLDSSPPADARALRLNRHSTQKGFSVGSPYTLPLEAGTVSGAIPGPFVAARSSSALFG
jgi:hypothetical protein